MSRTLARAITVFLLIFLLSPQGIYSMVMPLQQWINAVQTQAPVLKEEIAHTLAMKHNREAAERNVLPKLKVFVEQSYVRSSTDSGFLINARIEMPLFNKTKDYLLAKIARLEEESYQFQTEIAKAERLFEIRSNYAELQFILKTLPLLREKQKILNDVMKSEIKLNAEKIRSLNDMKDIYQEKILLDQTIEAATLKLAILQSQMANLAGCERKTLVFDETLDEICPKELAYDLAHWLEMALSENPEILELELRVSKQKICKTIAKRKYLPEVSAVSTYARDPRFVGNEDQLFVGIQAKLDLWDFGSTHESIKKEEALLEEAEVRLRNKKNELIIQIEEAFNTALASLKIFNSLESYHEFQKKVMEEWTRRFEQGETSKHDYSFARVRFLSAEIFFENARKDALQKKAAFYRSLGNCYFEEGSL